MWQHCPGDSHIWRPIMSGGVADQELLILQTKKLTLEIVVENFWHQFNWKVTSTGVDGDFTRSPNESGFMVNKRAMYEPGAVMVCSQKRACCVVSMGFAAIIAVALIVAFTKPGIN
ncbi:hypothetical protein E2C01_023065 [Portunus trituberculatus]|uniref:Uncharacterized protein n=1 Tax=Portunus trituberculatus TaxID=210409 RepID=A0A5B7EAK0_PORTR|nr:hypothetical protein [Portunus trituberculatus]